MVAVLAAAGAFSAPVSAAQQGEMAATSRGSVVIRATVANRVLVSGVTDVPLAASSGIGTATVLQRLCIRSNSATGRYDLVASGEAAGGAFVLTTADRATVPISLIWIGGSAIGAALLPGLPVQGLADTQINCSDDAGTSLAISVPVNNSPTVGAITLTFSPL